MRNSRPIKAFASLVILISLTACGKQESASGVEQYVCNKIGAQGTGDDVQEFFSCYDAKTLEVCTVVADAASGKRIDSSCLGHQQKGRIMKRILSTEPKERFTNFQANFMTTGFTETKTIFDNKTGHRVLTGKTYADARRIVKQLNKLSGVK